MPATLTLPARRRGAAQRLLRAIALAAIPMLVHSESKAATSCSLVGLSGLSFGAYDPLEKRSMTMVGAIVLKCSQAGNTPSLPVLVELSTGNSGTYSVRQLRKGAESLRYNLYLDAANIQVFGNGGGGSSHSPPLLPPDNVETTINIYGRLFPGQAVSAGTYTDSIFVTIDY